MEYQATSLLGSKEIGIEFTAKPVTPWGGLLLFSGLARQVGLEEALREALPFQLTSPNATDPAEVVLAFMTGAVLWAIFTAQPNDYRSSAPDDDDD